MNQIASKFRRLGDAEAGVQRQPLGQMLLDSGQVSVKDLLPALSDHKTLGVPLGQVVCAQGHLSQTALYDQLAQQWELPRDRLYGHVDETLIRDIGLSFCLLHKAIPVRVVDGVLFIAVSDMGSYSAAERDLEERFGLVSPLIASPNEIDSLMATYFSTELADMAANDLPFDESCRGLSSNSRSRNSWGIGALLVSLVLGTFFPVQVCVGVTFAAIFISVTSAILKIAALAANLSSKTKTNPQPLPQSLPKVSVMVPLHREPDVATLLVKRLGKLTYPKPILEILLVIEENDTITNDALAGTSLPPWMKAVLVPEGNPKTKPRALNHAFKFCTGDIIGIYDAEDAPDADQIEKVVTKFAHSDDNVACLQGILQFYNPTQNWLARCFAMDYAAWFRVILPGLSKLGMPVPLGGTTLFLKRAAIEEMKGWDAHNVTEDADLGLRLNRAGFRTELIDSVTGEEANCYGWKWIRQRSRWIKGYMVTYWAHMQHPLALWRDLGTKAFIGFQILFLSTIFHFLTGPILWSFLLASMGIHHVFFTNTPPILATVTTVIFLTVEAFSMAIISVACIRANRSFLIPWIPTMSFYFLMAVPAGWKAAWEFFKAPVYWDKTDHGHSLEET